MDIKGCVITMDAMGCQKNIVEKIVEKKAKYVLAVKENQKGLYEGIKETVMLGKPTCQYKDIETGNAPDVIFHWKENARERPE